MKKVKTLLTTLVAVALIGCATNPTYKTLAAVETTTTSAYNSYLTLVVSGNIPTNSVPAVSRDYNLFQTVMSATISVAAQGTNSPATIQVSTAAAQVIADITAATNNITIK